MILLLQLRTTNNVAYIQKLNIFSQSWQIKNPLILGEGHLMVHIRIKLNWMLIQS